MPSTRYAIYRHDATRRGLAFLLTREEFLTFWGQPCTYCGAGIEGIGLDRVDSLGGYTVDNVVPCCWLCNAWKSFLTLDEFRSHLLRVQRVFVERLPPETTTPTLPSRRKDRKPVAQPLWFPKRKRKTGGRPQGHSPRLIADALRTANGHIGATAELLGCSRSTIWRYMTRYPDLRNLGRSP